MCVEVKPAISFLNDRTLFRYDSNISYTQTTFLSRWVCSGFYSLLIWFEFVASRYTRRENVCDNSWKTAKAVSRESMTRLLVQWEKKHNITYLIRSELFHLDRINDRFYENLGFGKMYIFSFRRYFILAQVNILLVPTDKNIFFISRKFFLSADNRITASRISTYVCIHWKKFWNS